MVLPIAYFPPVSWFKALLNEPCRIESHENYIKQTLRNRCLIATASGIQRLSIPINKAQKLTDVLLTRHDNWQQKHWNAICAAYGESAFFDYYADDLHPLFTPETLSACPTLFDYDILTIRTALQLLDVEEELSFTTLFEGEDYTTADIAPAPPYYQVFREKTGFLPDLSILDLLFNLGPEGVCYLMKKGR